MHPGEYRTTRHLLTDPRAGQTNFASPPSTGILTLRTLDDLSARADELMAWVRMLEQRIEKLEKALARQK